MNEVRATERRYRLWIARCANWRPRDWQEVPQEARAVEPVDDTLYTADEAALFLEGFNRVMLASAQQLWAVAVPITLRYDGDAARGENVRGTALVK